jgi:hypothetical protein
MALQIILGSFKLNFTQAIFFTNMITFFIYSFGGSPSMITDKHNQLTFDISRKSTSTFLITYSNSCHPKQHNNSSFNFLLNRMNTYSVTNSSKNNKLQYIRRNNITQPFYCLHLVAKVWQPSTQQYFQLHYMFRPWWVIFRCFSLISPSKL